MHLAPAAALSAVCAAAALVPRARPEPFEARVCGPPPLVANYQETYTGTVHQGFSYNAEIAHNPLQWTAEALEGFPVAVLVSGELVPFLCTADVAGAARGAKPSMCFVASGRLALLYPKHAGVVVETGANKFPRVAWALCHPRWGVSVTPQVLSEGGEDTGRGTLRKLSAAGDVRVTLRGEAPRLPPSSCRPGGDTLTASAPYAGPYVADAAINYPVAIVSTGAREQVECSGTGYGDVTTREELGGEAVLLYPYHVGVVQSLSWLFPNGEGVLRTVLVAPGWRVVFWREGSAAGVHDLTVEGGRGFAPYRPRFFALQRAPAPGVVFGSGTASGCSFPLLPAR